MQTIESEYEGQVLHIDTHISGEFFFPEVVPHRMRYNVGPIPHVQFDGLVSRIGAGSCDGCADTYRGILEARIAETSLLSPIELSVLATFDGGQATVTATAEQVDDLELPDLQVSLFLIEDDLIWCCDSQGGSQFDAVTRAVAAVPISISFGGGSVNVAQVFTLDPGWDLGNLWAVAIIENVDLPREIHQSAQFRDRLRVELDLRVSSVVPAPGSIEVSGRVRNGNEASDDFDLSVVSEDGWVGEFRLDGEPDWVEMSTFSLAPGEERDLTLRVQTDATVEIGTTILTIDAQSSTFSSSEELRVFNGSPAVLFVDADNNADRGIEVPFRNALNRAVPLFDDVVVTGAGRGPRAEDLQGYDLLVWETGFLGANAISSPSGLSLIEFIESGGSLFLNCMGFAEAPGNTPGLQAALGIDPPVSNTGAVEAHGVTGDPITDGLVVDLEWADPNENGVDRIAPLQGATDAATTLQNGFGVSNAVRFETPSGGRTVLNTIELEAFGPVVGETVAVSILAWLLGEDGASSIPDLDPAPYPNQHVPLSGRGSTFFVAPNPFVEETEIRFSVDRNEELRPLEIQIHDTTGRLVRNLWLGSLPANDYDMKWDGNDDRGVTVPPGVYFAVLRTDDGRRDRKLIRLSR